jgi:hypothetical protein
MAPHKKALHNIKPVLYVKEIPHEMTVDSCGIFAYYERARHGEWRGLGIPLFYTLAKVHKSMKEEYLFVITVAGEDRVGLVASVTSLLFKAGLNIVDIEQSAIHSQFTMVLFPRII